MSVLRILIFGAGGHGKVVADVARSRGLEVIGYVDRDPQKLGMQVEGGGGRVLFTEDIFPQFAETGTIEGERIAAALGIGDNAARMRYVNLLRACTLPSLVHRRATVSPEATIGAASIVAANCVVNPGARVGQGVIINSAAVVEHDCVIGDGSHVAPSATLAGGVHLGRQVFVGAQAVIVQGITIGDFAVIGAGSVVLSDVSAETTVVGNPGRPRRGFDH